MKLRLSGWPAVTSATLRGPVLLAVVLSPDRNLGKKMVPAIRSTIAPIVTIPLFWKSDFIMQRQGSEA
jgi:hypothetical protein